MHFGLTDEQEMIVDTVRSFVEHEIYPHERQVERTGYASGTSMQTFIEGRDIASMAVFLAPPRPASFRGR